MTNIEKITKLKNMAIDYALREISRQFTNWCRDVGCEMTQKSYEMFLNVDSINLDQANEIFKIYKKRG